MQEWLSSNFSQSATAPSDDGWQLGSCDILTKELSDLIIAANLSEELVCFSRVGENFSLSWISKFVLIQFTLVTMDCKNLAKQVRFIRSLQYPNYGRGGWSSWAILLSRMGQAECIQQHCSKRLQSPVAITSKIAAQVLIGWECIPLYLWEGKAYLLN